MLVVSSTSPLLNLAILDALDLLVQQFRTLLLPEAVFAELQIDSNLPGASSLQSAYQGGLFRVEPVTDRVRVRLLQRDLDAGEAEAIALALEKSADWLLLDERDGRRAAKALGLRVTGVLGILLKARLQGQLPSLRQAMDDLRNRAGFRISDALYGQLLIAAGESMR